MLCIREFKQPQQLLQVRLHLKINICAMVTILRRIVAFCSHSLLLINYAKKWTSRSAVEVNTENERFTAVC